MIEVVNEVVREDGIGSERGRWTGGQIQETGDEIMDVTVRGKEKKNVKCGQIKNIEQLGGVACMGNERGVSRLIAVELKLCRSIKVEMNDET